MNKSSLNNPKEKKQQSTTILNYCRICGDTAVYSHYGVISCQSCKIFFRRNATQKLEASKCKSNGHCKVHKRNRHLCSYCRLKKCFSSGMQVEMIRCPRSKPNTVSPKTKISVAQVQKPLETLVQFNEVARLPTLSLLQADHSTLSISQWILLSNISHCFDEYSGLELGERYIREQLNLPLKSRFKSTSLIEYLHKILAGIQLLYKNNKDFLSLSSNDRSILLHSTIQHTGSLSANFIHHQIGLTSYPAYYHTVELITHPSLVPATKRIYSRLGFDMITMKLFLAILSFSTTKYTYYANTPPIILTNIKEVLRIQNTYIELTWKYLVYKHNFEEAVRCFSDLLRCIFATHDALVMGEDIKWFTEKMDSIAERTRQTLNLND